jgi:hypothetical protein
MVLATRLLLGGFLWRHVSAQDRDYDKPLEVPELNPTPEQLTGELVEMTQANDTGTLSKFFGELKASKQASEGYSLTVYSNQA